MVNRLFKVASLVGCGVLAAGAGSLGSYFAQPYLESKFNPERKDREDLLQESFEEVTEELALLEKSLNEAQQENETKQESISSLNKEVERFKDQISEQDKQLLQKDEDLKNKKDELQKQVDLNNQQDGEIKQLTSEFNGLKKTLEQETKNKQDAQTNLQKVIDRVSLTREDILTKPYDQNSLKINIRKTTWDSFSGGVSKFNTIDADGQNKSFSVKSNNRPNHEQIAEEIKRKGIPVKLDPSFTTWEKIIEITRYDISYDFTTTDPNKKDYLVNTSKTTTRKIKLSEYFKSEYHEEAFKVLVAIVFLDIFPICRDTSNNDVNQPYLFCKSISQDFKSTDKPWSWNAFSGKDETNNKFMAYLNSFATIEDFINYWTQKTVDFVKTGTVDLFDFLNPIVLAKSYQAS